MRFWSPTLGSDAARVSMFDAHGREFYMIVPDEGGQAWRDRRDTCVEALATAIDMNLDPGEVRTS